MNNLKGVYQGPYTLEVTSDYPLEILPKVNGLESKTGKITVQVGTVQQSMGSMQMYACNEPFSIGYKFLKRILDKDGEILWENNYIKTM